MSKLGGVRPGRSEERRESGGEGKRGGLCYRMNLAVTGAAAWTMSDKPQAFVLLFTVVYAALFVFLSIYKHEIYASSRFDLGNMDQAVWNSARGNILAATDETGEITSRLRNHTDFLLLAFVPLYWIVESPYWLLIVQAVTVAAGAIPLYWLCRRFLAGYAWPAALISVAYLFNPGLHGANLFDFHSQMMAGTLLLFAFHYMLEKRLWPFLAFAVLAATTKEEIVLLVAMMGLYAIWPLKRPKWGVPIFTLGTAYFLLVMLVIIPSFNVGGTSNLVGDRYEAFGGSMGGLLVTALTDPLFILGYVLSGPRLDYLLQLASLGGGLPLLSPLVLAIPLPEIAINVISQRPQMVSLRYHYSAPVLPFVYLATAAGLYTATRLMLRLRQWGRFPGRWTRRFLSRRLLVVRAPLLISLFILLSTVQASYNTGPLPWFHAPDSQSSVVDPPPERHLAALNEAVAMIPDDASVSASNRIGPHLAHRDYLYLFPLVRDADYVVLDERYPGYDTFIEPVVSVQSVRNLRESADYELVYEVDGVLVFERGEGE